MIDKLYSIYLISNSNISIALVLSNNYKVTVFIVGKSNPHDRFLHLGCHPNTLHISTVHQKDLQGLIQDIHISLRKGFLAAFRMAATVSCLRV